MMGGPGRPSMYDDWPVKVAVETSRDEHRAEGKNAHTG